MPLKRRLYGTIGLLCHLNTVYVAQFADCAICSIPNLIRNF